MTEMQSDTEVNVKPIFPLLRVDIPTSTQLHTSLSSPPLREISPDQPVSAALENPKVRPKQVIPSDKARFPPRTDDGEKQCTNCGETDTPQWRGTLCNACALWRRSRGTDRPLPLLFPVRKRPRSPSLEPEPEYDPDQGNAEDEEGVEGMREVEGFEGRQRNNMFWRDRGESALAVYERQNKAARGPVGGEQDAQFGKEAGELGKCMVCGERAAVLVDSWALCGGCLRNGRASVSLLFPSSRISSAKTG